MNVKEWVVKIEWSLWVLVVQNSSVARIYGQMNLHWTALTSLIETSTIQAYCLDVTLERSCPFLNGVFLCVLVF